MVEIKRLGGNTILALDDIPEGALVHRELMGDHYVKLSFTLEEPVYLHLGDYVKLDTFGRFELTEPYSPKYNSETAGYDYTLQLDAYYMKWRNKKVRYIPAADASETSFHLTATIDVHLSVLVNGLNAIGAKDYNFRYENNAFVFQLVNFPEDKIKAAKYKQYQNTDFISALNDLATIFGCEWWVEGNIIYFGKCKLDAAEIEFVDGENVGEMSCSESKNDYATRIIVFGSDRNLPPDYRKDNSADITQNGVVQKRLMLPSKGIHACPYGHIQDDSVNNETEAIEAVVVNDDIYPRTTCVVERYDTYISTTEDEETGETISQTFYRLYDNSGFIFSSEYILEGETLHILFQSGKMNGMDFECQYNDKKKYYEVVANTNYGRTLPDTELHPEVGDEFVIYGWDSTKIGNTGLIEAAEEELYQYAIGKLADLKIDPNTYTCIMQSDWYADKMDADTFTIYSLGQPVRLISPTYFANGRSSRIIGFEVKIDIPYDNPEYIVGEAVAYSRLQDMQDKIDSLTFNGASYNGKGSGNGSGVYVITTTSQTPASDYNVYSAMRSNKEFLNKNKADRAKGKIIFDEGLDLGDFRAGVQGGRLDEKGNAELLTIVVRQLLCSPKFVDGLTGEGWRIWLEDSLSHLTIDKLTVRQIMVVLELLIEKVRSVGGQLCVSAANGKIKEVRPATDGYEIVFEQENTFQEGDLMRCATFSGGSLKSYWVEVYAATSTNSILIKQSEFDDWSCLPEAGDECVLMGNTENPLRQNLILISATEDGQPRVDVMDHVTAKNFSGCLRARLGNLDGISDDWFPADNQPHGNGLYSDNAYLRGTFLLVTGEDIKTKFEIVEGKISSYVEAVRQDFMQDKGFLNNPTFGNGLSYWTTENDTIFFFLGQRWIWANNNVLSKKGDGASLTTDDGRSVVRIRNKSIIQKSSDYRSLPDIKTNEDGRKEPVAVYLSFYYKVRKAGTLTVGFENINNDGFVEYEPLSYSKELDVTEIYQQLTVSGLWNGTGDFTLSFTGEILVYMLVLSTDKIEALTYTYRTLFEQSEKLVRIAAENFDRDGNVLESSSIITASKYNALISERFNDDGSLLNTAGLVTSSAFSEVLEDYVKITSFAGLFASAVATDENIVKHADISAFITEDDFNGLISHIHLGADQITLEGLVTANGNFKILEDGSIETVEGSIGGWKISSDGISRNNVVMGSDGSIGNGSYWKLGNDGSGFLARGNVKWDTAGNVSLANLGALEGTFTGKINANKGIVFPVETLYGAGQTISPSVTFSLIIPTEDNNYQTFYFPASPTKGQYLTIKNISYVTQLQIQGNGHRIRCDSTGGIGESDDNTYNAIWVGSTRAKQFVFDGTYWEQIGYYDY